MLMLYYRVFSPNRVFRYKIYALLSFAALMQLASIPLNAAFCAPAVGASWAPPNRNCPKSYVYALFAGAANVLVDLCVIYLPIPMILGLNLPLKKRIGVLAIFLTGCLYVAFVSRDLCRPAPTGPDLLIIHSALIASSVAMVYRVRTWQGTDAFLAGYMTCFLRSRQGSRR